MLKWNHTNKQSKVQRTNLANFQNQKLDNESKKKNSKGCFLKISSKVLSKCSSSLASNIQCFNVSFFTLVEMLWHRFDHSCHQDTKKDSGLLVVYSSAVFSVILSPITDLKTVKRIVRVSIIPFTVGYTATTFSTSIYRVAWLAVTRELPSLESL